MCDAGSKIGALGRFFFGQRVGPQPQTTVGGIQVPGGPAPLLPSRFQQYGLPVLQGAGAGAMAAPGPTSGLAAPGFLQQFFTGLGAAGLSRRQLKMQDLEQQALLARIAEEKTRTGIAQSAEARAQAEQERRMKLLEQQSQFLGLGAETTPSEQDIGAGLGLPSTPPEQEISPAPAILPPTRESLGVPVGPLSIPEEALLSRPRVPARQLAPSVQAAAPARPVQRTGIDKLIANLGLNPDEMNPEEKARFKVAAAADIGTGSLAHVNQAGQAYATRKAIQAAQAAAVANRNVSTQEDLRNRIAVAFEKGDMEEVARLRRVLAATELPKEPAPGAGDTKLQRSYEFHTRQLETLRKPIDERVNRVQRLVDSLDQRTPMADSLIAPELLTAMAGGIGSGLRMNEAEIARIVGGRSNWETLKAKLNQWRTDPSKALTVTDAQREQMYALVRVINARVQRQQAALDDAQLALVDAPDAISHRRIFAETRRRLSSIMAESKGASMGNPAPIPIPSGAQIGAPR